MLATNSEDYGIGRLRPFLKWAGGKRWLARHYLEAFPAQFSTYIEPFLGSGAVFFALQPTRAILADSNVELISTYLAVRDNPQGVQKLLNKFHRTHTRKVYYKSRATLPSTILERAARFIYLNRTCWNGLYRVNKQGLFNVPKGTKNKVLLPSDNFQSVSCVLKTAKLAAQDFEETIDLAQTGDLVFADPPYTVQHNNNGFTKYNEKLFSWDDQVRLRDCLVSASKRGVLVVATNADSRSIRRLYENYFSVRALQRPSVIAGDSAQRRDTTELLITSQEGAKHGTDHKALP